jgi:glycerophosphoryl diester phosphodiesterase
MLRCIGSLLALPLLYYGIQAALRTPSRSPGWIIAHRGGLKYAPENTLAAFRNAIAQGADWLEFDVQMTRDGQLLVIHDETVDRTTNGTGAVRDLTLEQVRGLDAGNREKVPPFAEVLQLAKASRIRIMPETKSAHLYPGLEEKLVQAVEHAGYIDQTIVQSFEGDSLEKLHRLNPNLQLCQLYRQWQFDTSNPHGEAQFVCPLAEMVLLDPGMIRQAHNHGRQIIVWFGAIESPFTVKVLRFFGADGFIVNDPPAAKAALGR